MGSYQFLTVLFLFSILVDCSSAYSIWNLRRLISEKSKDNSTETETYNSPLPSPVPAESNSTGNGNLEKRNVPAEANSTGNSNLEKEKPMGAKPLNDSDKGTPIRGNDKINASVTAPNDKPTDNGKSQDQGKEQKDGKANSGSNQNGDCEGSAKRCSVPEKMVACIQDTENGTEGLVLLVINQGEKPLKVKVAVPENQSWRDGFNAHGIPKNQSEKVKLPLSMGQSTKIVLKAAGDECVINIGNSPSLRDFMQGIPSYYKQVTPIYAAYFVFLITLIVGGIWTSCFLLKRRRQDGGVAYQELEMGVPESSASAAVNGVGDTDTQGWDEGWDDDWEEDKAVVKASGNNISSNGLTARSPNKEGWENDWDD